MEVKHLDARTQKVRYPEAMRDMGTPAEMSPIEDITGEPDDAAFVEVTRPMNVGEPAELDSLTTQNIAQERKNRL